MTETATIEIRLCGLVPCSVDGVVGHCRNQQLHLQQLASGDMQQQLPQGVTPLPASATSQPWGASTGIGWRAAAHAGGPRVAEGQAQDADVPLLPWCNCTPYCRRPARLSRRGPSWQQMRLAGMPSSRLLHEKAGSRLSARSASYSITIVVQGTAWLLQPRAANAADSPASRLASWIFEDDGCYRHCCEHAWAKQDLLLQRCMCLGAEPCCTTCSLFNNAG